MLGSSVLRQIFQSFLQAGYECSTHKLRNGRRLDLVSATQHDRFVREDYDRALSEGMQTVREGLRWPLIEQTPGKLSFTSLYPFLTAAREKKIQIIWDILHFGWPDHLDVFKPEFVISFGELALNFARLLRDQGAVAPLIAPVNEISFVAWAGGDVAYLNPFEQGRGGELKMQLARAFLAATEAVRSILPETIIVSPEPVINIVGDPKVPGDVESARAYTLSMFEAWDMLSGRLRPECGGYEGAFDVIGVNYYDRNQWRNFGTTIWRDDPDYRPFREILMDVWTRYRRPLFVSETGTEDEKRPGWFAYIAAEVRAAVALGAPVEGICLYPVLNHPGWNDDRHCRNGLWDYASETGEREIYAPLAIEINKQEKLRLLQEQAPGEKYGTAID
jgi:hypothetical protein